MLENQLPTDDCNFWHELDWQVQDPFILAWTVAHSDIDHYGHANNAAYVKQMENLAWAHSQSLGLGIDEYRNLNRAMVISQHQINYLRACHEDDVVATATWISSCDQRLRLQRGFQFIHMHTHKVVLSAVTDYVCIDLKTGKPAKMPVEFTQAYGDSLQEKVIK